MTASPRTVINAGVCYLLWVFAAAALFGALRVQTLVPRFGAITAVALELPWVWLVSWYVARILVRRYVIPPRPGPRLAMGGVAFVLLLAAEAALAVFVLDRPLRAHLAGYGAPDALLGLAGQAVFGLMPWLLTVRSSASA